MTKEQQDFFEKKHDIDFAYTAKGIARFRINFYRQKNGLAGAFRPILENVKTIDELGLPPALKKVTKYNNGLVLIT